MFVNKFDPPENSPRKHGKDQLVQAPPFFKHDSMMTALDETPVAMDALVAVVLGNLETQFHAGIKDFERPICHTLVRAQAVRAEQEKRQAAFEKRLLRRSDSGKQDFAAPFSRLDI